MAGEKKICCCIMLCQMIAILSGVAMLYLSIIVVIPATDELSLGFHSDPIMCTTVDAEDVTAGGKKDKSGNKVKCDWSTCGEWCLSKSSTPCMQIYVMARRNGSEVKFSSCYDVTDIPCSALDVNLTLSKKCRLGECKELNGLYNCTKEGENECREITPAYNCKSSIDKETIICTEEKCGERLGGVYTCSKGSCNKLISIKHYWKDCQRKCTDLKLGDVNVVIFSRERLITTKCTSVHSPSNNTVNEINSLAEWSGMKKVLFVYCTYYRKTHGERGYDLHTGDCFNATVGEASRINNITNYLRLQDYVRELHNTSEYLIEPEENLRLMNKTVLKINPEGCVNSLKKECKSFFETHATDGRDGKTKDRFPCYFADNNTEYVIGKYNPDVTYLYLMFATYLPGSLFIFSCFCLFICSKSVGIDDEGHLKLTLLQTATTGGNSTDCLMSSS